MTRQRLPLNTPPEPFTRVTLSCGHVQFKVPPIPKPGDTIVCTAHPIDDTPTVTEVDRRRLEVYCPDCKAVLVTVSLLATITARTKVDVHNIRDMRGHHATVRETGSIET